MNTLKNLYLILIGLILLPFALCVAICSIPFFFHSFIILITDFDFNDDDVWRANVWLEDILNLLVSPFTK